MYPSLVESSTISPSKAVRHTIWRLNDCRRGVCNYRSFTPVPKGTLQALGGLKVFRCKQDLKVFNFKHLALVQVKKKPFKLLKV